MIKNFDPNSAVTLVSKCYKFIYVSATKWWSYISKSTYSESCFEDYFFFIIVLCGDLLF